MLRNYEHRTGETLNRHDLEEKGLAAKLIPEDYDLKSQVFYSFIMPTPFIIILAYLSAVYKTFQYGFHFKIRNLQVTALVTTN